MLFYKYMKTDKTIVKKIERKGKKIIRNYS